MKDPIKSLDETSLIASILRTVSTAHEQWLKPREYKRSVAILRARVQAEGLSVLTIALPRLGKAFDKALTNTSPMVYSGWTSYKDVQNQEHNFPSFMGELFRRVLDQHGTVLPSPCVASVRYIRQVLYLFYKYDLPYPDELNQAVLTRFVKTEEEVHEYNKKFKAYYENAFPEFIQVRGRSIASNLDSPAVRSAVILNTAEGYQRPRIGVDGGLTSGDALILTEAQRLLSILFKDIDLQDIKPRHGPGSVSTGERTWEKYVFTAVPAKLHRVYPYDAYFCASLGHVCDSYDYGPCPIVDREPLAKVVLVPKDSRGPRLISEEPLAYQWIQQGIRRKLYTHVENHRLTRWNVFFTNQEPNQRGALLGSKTGKYATLDLKDASDRVGLWLVRCLFPGTVLPYLEASRSVGTVMPSGQEVYFSKFAPMGSALCFPIMALTIWSLLTAAAEDTDTREGILVYGDDVIVPTAFAAHAIETLERFGLKANLDKCCISGSFRESCGVDAFNGENVTPLRIRKLIPSRTLSRKKLRACPEVYLSWLAYARRLHVDGYLEAYDLVVEHLLQVYGRIPSDEEVGSSDSFPLSLPSVPTDSKPHPKRVNDRLQRRELLTWGVAVKPTICEELSGWLRLLRYHTEVGHADIFGSYRTEESLAIAVAMNERDWSIRPDPDWCSARYTERRSAKLIRRWRGCYTP